MELFILSARPPLQTSATPPPPVTLNKCTMTLSLAPPLSNANVTCNRPTDFQIHQRPLTPAHTLCRVGLEILTIIKAFTTGKWKMTTCFIDTLSQASRPFKIAEEKAASNIVHHLNFLTKNIIIPFKYLGFTCSFNELRAQAVEENLYESLYFHPSLLPVKQTGNLTLRTNEVTQEKHHEKA